MRFRRLLIRYALPLLAAVLAVVAVRGLIVAQYALPADIPSAGLSKGDRVIVLRPAYGLRVPWTRPEARRRWGHRPARKGDVVVFRHPLAKGTCVARCEGAPGDTVWIDLRDGRLLPGRTATTARPFVVPGREHPVDVTPWNARLLHAAITRHERSRAGLRGDTALLFDGRPLPRAYFTQDYYWMEGTAGHYGLVPQSHLEGRVVCTSYSIDSSQPFYRCLRTDRFFRPVR